MSRIEDMFLKIAPVRLMDVSLQDSIRIDISNKNETLRTFDVSSSQAWELYIDSYLKANHAKMAYGGYLEIRDIYSRSSYFNDSSSQERNIHLGIDLWTKAGSSVFAPLDGIVHSFYNNTNYGDYGPTIILEHCISGVNFYTLYGHLSLDSISDLNHGDRIGKGTIIGYLGDASVNGDYAPHLHFQLIIDIEDYQGDYPGVCAMDDLDFYKKNCPDPNLLLKLPT